MDPIPQFDQGAPPLGETLEPRDGNIDNPFDTFLKNKGGGGGLGEAPSFAVSYNSESGELSISAGQYFKDNTATGVVALEATIGLFAYIRIKHSSAGVLDDVSPFTLDITDTERDPIDMDDPVTGTYVEYTNVLLTKVVEVDGESTLNPQLRWGNVELVHGFSDGLIHYVPVFSGGSI